MATPEQCPECARFLSKTFVTGLAESDAACPKCGTTLTAEMFGVTEGAASEAATPAVSDAGAATASSSPPPRKRVVPADDESVRPSDVLEGWDEDRAAGYGAPPDGATVVALPAEAALAIGVICAGAGFVIARRHPVWGAVLGAASGMVAAVAGRTIYGRAR